ncbi:hypothetical protein MRX96_040506 [Rhipicephalus microplus]
MARFPAGQKNCVGLWKGCATPRRARVQKGEKAFGATQERSGSSRQVSPTSFIRALPTRRLDPHSSRDSGRDQLERRAALAFGSRFAPICGISDDVCRENKSSRIRGPRGT